MFIELLRINALKTVTGLQVSSGREERVRGDECVRGRDGGRQNVCVCVCVCACERERGRKRERDRERERLGQRDSQGAEEKMREIWREKSVNSSGAVMLCYDNEFQKRNTNQARSLTMTFSRIGFQHRLIL